MLEVTPRGFYQNAGMDHIVVKVRARIVAYVIDDRTGRVISGDRNREKFMEYEWDLCRKRGVITGAAAMQTVSCPHCGAPLNINQTAKCPFCGSIVTLVNEDWALNNIKGVSQQTVLCDRGWLKRPRGTPPASDGCRFCEKCGMELPILDEAGTGNAGVSETPKADNAGGPVPP